VFIRFIIRELTQFLVCVFIQFIIRGLTYSY